MLSSSVVERIKERLSIIDVLSSYLALQESGSQYKAKCPFHNERTASFSVSPDKGLYYCFGCGAKGDIFTFVQEFEGVDFNGALRLLATRAGVPLTRESFRKDSTAPLYEVLEEAATIYASALENNDSAKKYLLERGVTEEAIKKFRIGYAPEGWEFIAQRFRGPREAQAKAVGLLKPGERGFYDRFRARIMFPITDTAGRTVGFSGRSFPDMPDVPKYLNSPETELFQKSKLLFGFDKAKFDIKRRNFCILVEGQFDLVLSHQAGFTNTIAASGTTLAEEANDGTGNLATVARLTKNIILAYDGDEAGKKAMDRAARVALRLGMNPKVAVLPEGNDPADFIKTAGAVAWKDRLVASEHVVVFQIKDLLAKNLSPHRFAAGLRERVFPYLRLIPSSIERAQQLELVSSVAGIPFSALQDDFSQFLVTQPQSISIPADTVRKKQQFDTVTLFLGILAWQDEAAEKLVLSEDYRTRLATIAFEDTLYHVPDVSGGILHAARMYAAATYGTLAKPGMTALLNDQLHSIEILFLESLRRQFTTELHQAERIEDEVRTGELLNLLQKLAARVQKIRMQ